MLLNCTAEPSLEPAAVRRAPLSEMDSAERKDRARPDAARSETHVAVFKMILAFLQPKTMCVYRFGHGQTIQPYNGGVGFRRCAGQRWHKSRVLDKRGGENKKAKERARKEDRSPPPVLEKPASRSARYFFLEYIDFDENSGNQLASLS